MEAQKAHTEESSPVKLTKDKDDKKNTTFLKVTFLFLGLSQLIGW